MVPNREKIQVQHKWLDDEDALPERKANTSLPAELLASHQHRKWHQSSVKRKLPQSRAACQRRASETGSTTIPRSIWVKRPRGLRSCSSMAKSTTLCESEWSDGTHDGLPREGAGSAELSLLPLHGAMLRDSRRVVTEAHSPILIQ